MTLEGFMVSEHHDPIPVRTIETWRGEFPHIANLEAQLGKLAAVILRKGSMHPGWAQPAAWMRGCLAEDNAKAKRDTEFNQAKIAQLSNRRGAGQHGSSDWLRSTVGPERYERLMANSHAREGKADA